MTDPQLFSPFFFYFLMFMFVGYKFADIEVRWTPQAIGCAVLVGSALIAIPISFFFEERYPAATAFLAFFLLLQFPLIFLKDITRIYYALVPVAYLQAALMVWQWFFEGVGRASGLTYNMNTGASMLLLVSIFLSTQARFKWLAVPLLAVIPFSGSRWVIIIGVAVFGLLFCSKVIPWRYLLVGSVLALLVVTSSQFDGLAVAYRVTGDTDQTTALVKENIVYRLDPADLLVWSPSILIPKGYVLNALHSIPLRLTVESGLVSALAWLGVGAMVLFRKPRWGWQWWGMLTVMLLGVMYYFPLVHMGWMWWLLARGNASDAAMSGVSVSPIGASR